MSLSTSEINLNIVQFKRVNTKWYRNEILESQFSITSKKLTVAKKNSPFHKNNPILFRCSILFEFSSTYLRILLSLYQFFHTSDNILLTLPF